MKSITYSLSLIICIGIVACSSPEEKRKKKILDAIEKTGDKVSEESEKTIDFLQSKEKEIKEKIEE
ncbi:MAG TPA: hypothetical protein PK734_00705 [Bacteroidales bacterium]|nr:MAG: hypothetical protein BWY22_01432 [Bacteroidetes bacterium ADurb.Bin217]HOS84547.1 hypothetical protein [Bacteroidales bacterium]HPM11990.1 hypothetical protein [Bacteroidales bacterium]